MTVKNKKSDEFYRSGVNAYKPSSLFPYFGALSKVVYSSFFITALVGILLLTDKPFWFPYVERFISNASDSNATFSVYSVFFVLSVYSVFFVLLALIPSLIFYVVRRTKRSLAIKKNIHDLVHFVRDFQTDYYLVENKANFNTSVRTYDLLSLIKSHFDLLIPNCDIKVAVRLYSEKNEVFAYHTIERAGLSADRENTTSPLSPKDSLPRFFNNERGVLIINDIYKSDHYKPQENDRKFNDYKSVMVAPINGYDAESENNKLIGLLFISSNDQCFNQIHVDSIAFIADMLAIFFVMLTVHKERLQSKIKL